MIQTAPAYSATPAGSARPRSRAARTNPRSSLRGKGKKPSRARCQHSAMSFGCSRPRNVRARSPIATPGSRPRNRQWCAYPDVRCVSKITPATFASVKVPLFRVYRGAERRVGRQPRLRARVGPFPSDVLQRSIFGSNLRTPGLAVFHMLDLPHYNSARAPPSSALDTFLESKG